MSHAAGTADAVLGGRVLLDQRGAGLRATIDPVLLAATVPAREGEAVLDAGTGIGTAALCLLARVPGARAAGIERDPDQAATAAANAALNGWAGRFAVVTGDVAAADTVRDASGHGPFAHAMANPPWFAGGTAPAHPVRRGAKHEDGAAPLAAWVALLGHCLARRGTARVILPPTLLPGALAAFARAGIGSPTLLPLWPRAGEPARRLILAGRKGGRAACRILPGLVLHERDGRFTPEAEAVLRHAAPLPMG